MALTVRHDGTCEGCGKTYYAGSTVEVKKVDGEWKRWHPDCAPRASQQTMDKMERGAPTRIAAQESQSIADGVDAAKYIAGRGFDRLIGQLERIATGLDKLQHTLDAMHKDRRGPRESDR